VSGSSPAARTAKTGANRLPRTHRKSAAPSASTRARRNHDGPSASSPRPPSRAAANATCIGGSAQVRRGGTRPSRLMTAAPMPPSRPRSSSQWNAARTRSGEPPKLSGRGDDASPEDPASGVEDSRLAGRGPEERLAKLQTAARVHGGDRRRVVAQARLALERLLAHAVDEGHVLEGDRAHRQLLAPADDDRVRRRINPHHVPGSRLREIAEAASLADGVQGRPSMAADHPS